MTLRRSHRQRIAEAGFKASQREAGVTGHKSQGFGGTPPPALTTVMLISTLKSECAFFNLG